MIDFFPLKYYYDIYIYSSLFIVFFTLIHTWVLRMDDPKNINFIKVIGILLLFLLIFYVGLRPVSGRYFVDMRTYANNFNYYASGGELRTEKDIFFELFMRLCATLLSLHSFFLICAVLYIYPMYRISKTYFKEYWYYSFLLFIVSFSFWTYGVNGIRNGIATSLFLWGLSYQNNKVKMIVLFILAALCHKTLLLPIFAFVITIFYNKPKFYLIWWLMATPISIVLGGFLESLFASVGFADDRLGAYLVSDEAQQSSNSFRFDFLMYSAFAVFAGWYFIFKKHFTDKLYFQLFNTYLIVNGFWILIIRASFSNRFAYLSWFMMSIIIIYPLLKERFFKNQHLILGQVVLFYFSFTFFMFYIYYSD